MGKGTALHNQAEAKSNLLDLIANGKTLNQACAALQISPRTILRWRDADEEFDKDFEAAHQMMAIVMIDDGLTKLKELADGTIEPTKQLVAAVTAYSQRTAWMGSKLIRKVYGDESQAKQVNNFNGPVQALICSEQERQDLISTRNEALRLANKGTEQPNEILQPNHTQPAFDTEVFDETGDE